MKNKISPRSSSDIKIEKKLFRWQIYGAYYQPSSSDSFLSSGGWYNWSRITVIGYKTKERAIEVANKIETVCNMKHICIGIGIIISGIFFILITKNDSMIVSLFFSIPMFIIGMMIVVKSIPWLIPIRKNRITKTKEKYVYSDGIWKTINE
jgi:hypothetical protein